MPAVSGASGFVVFGRLSPAPARKRRPLKVFSLVRATTAAFGAAASAVAVAFARAATSMLIRSADCRTAAVWW